MTLTTKAPKLASLASTIVAACEALDLLAVELPDVARRSIRFRVK